MFLWEVENLFKVKSFPRSLIFSFMAAAFFILAPATLRALPYSPNQTEVTGAVNQGYDQGGVALGDYDADGDLDILVSGRDSGGNFQVRIFRHEASSYTLVNVAPANGGLQNSSVAFGDMDGDGDLDVLASGTDSGNTRRLRVYRNDGGNVFTVIDVDATLGAGANRCDVAWGDYDNDGDLDILFAGQDTGVRRLRVYRNLGNGTFDANPVYDVAGVDRADVAWGDYDNDGDLDILYAGRTGGGVGTAVLRIAPNNGDGTFGAAFNVLNAATGYSLGDVRWGDFDADGWLDILAAGTDQAGNPQWRSYRNNQNGTFTQANVAAVGTGYDNSSAAFGDVNNDGVLDAVIAGQDSGNLEEIRVSTYNAGSGTWTTVYNPESANNLGLATGGAALGAMFGNADLDIVVSGADSAGNRQLRVYKSSASLAVANTAPSAPSTLAARFSFVSTNTVAVASFTWNSGSDGGTGATPANGLYYDVQISTLATFARYVSPGLSTTPQMGSYLRPASIFGGATPIGVVLKSTNAWTTQNAHPGLVTDTTYYFRVRTIDAGLAWSGQSAAGTLWTGVAPSSVSLSAATGTNPGDILLTWLSPGDDFDKNNLTGNFRIQYATNTLSWSTSTTPSGATTVTIATTSAIPGSAQFSMVNVSISTTYYFVLWSQDEVGDWSVISPAVSTVPATIIRSVSLSTGTYDFGAQAVGASSVTASGIVATNNGNMASTFSLSAATSTAGTTWSVSSVTTPTPDVVVVFAAFDAARPPFASFGPEDLVTGTSTASTASVYSLGGQTGENVPVAGARTLWVGLNMPTKSSTALQQDVTLTVAAGP